MVPDIVKTLLISVSLLVVSSVSSQRTFQMESESAGRVKEEYHDPDIYLNVPQSVRRHGYSAEAHTVVTRDGYLLTLHRIPASTGYNSSRLLPVFLQHGLTGNSWLWILQGPGRSLAYMLADAGYDVWLGNARGSPDSRAHTSMPPSSSRFWDFSFHEMGVYDLPTVIDYITKITGSPQLHYVGHSMGTTMFFVMAAMKQEVAAKVASSHSLAPVVFANNIRTPLRRLAKYANDVRFLSLLVGNGELLPQSRLLKFVTRLGCETFLQDEKLCTRLDFAATGAGSDPQQYDPSLTPLLLAHPGNGASTKTAIHYLQLMKAGQFQQFDYGFFGNIVFYNATEPPVYDLSKVDVPTYLYYSDGDQTADTLDVELLFEKLRCQKHKFLVPLRKFNHMDFIVAKDARSLVYNQLLRDIEESALPTSERVQGTEESESNDIQVIMV